MQQLDNLLKEAGRLVKEENLVAALARLSEAPESLQKEGLFQFAKGTILFKNKDLGQAIIAYENAIKLGPPLPEFFSNLAVALLTRFQGEQSSEQDIDRAIELFERALDMGPQLPHIYVNLGGAWFQKNDSTKARYYFELALELFPDFEPAQLGLNSL